MMNNNIEDYQNLVELLKQALMYYANERVYDTGDGKKPPSIMNDGGFQAKFALSKIDEIESIYNEMEMDYMKNEIGENQDDDINNMFEIIKNLKKINNGY